MFFTASKVFWFFATPSNLLIVLAVLGLVVSRLGGRRLGGGLTAAAVLALAVLGASPLPRLMMRGLEDRFPARTAEDLGRIDGIIVLGGSVHLARGQPKLNDAGARMTAAAALARRFPDVRIVFSGGTGQLLRFDDDEIEADASRLLMASLGLDGPRVIYEDRSRNTRENAVFSKEAVKPRPGERWLLVTSAFHMPRSVGIFRQIGFDVVPYPVDFHTKRRLSDWSPFATFSSGLRLADLAAKEWIGLVSYRLAGYTDALFPAPAQETARHD
ncbi:YdcF family protein [Chelatococcus reniformis]|uniref:DUF218 domain-containing protein n=1 Tax=Chelatococcus reniformis TaxID=1494448 RepID=A0A916XAR2_9HYPH|nr:YdcF family protein [Chelatococcus reniformis]GGC57796.1 hypothetical protein GCM10010994_15970 [Chelatococcus reniformis]